MRKFVQNCLSRFSENVSNRFVAAFMLILFSVITNAQTVQTFTVVGSGSFTVPVGVTSIYVECWGGGGAGGNRTSNGVAGGGAGGAYAASTIAVTPGASLNYFVGAGGSPGFAAVDGGDSWFVSSSTVMAKGGESVNANTTAAGLAPAATASVGTTRYKGGDGRSGNTFGTDYGGGGGSSAGTGSNGTTASNQNGANAPAGGGDGGNGRYSSQGNGTDGSAPGGGGGGALRTSSGTRLGGDGGRGQIRITYTALTYKSQLVGSIDYGTSNWCSGTTRNITVQIKNIGTATWNDGGPGVINVGVKWNTNAGNWADYHVRVPAGTVAPNETATYVIPLTASNHNGTAYTTNLAAGSNNISVDLVYEGVSWFGDNDGGVGPGNTKFTTSAITIEDVPSSVIATGSPNPVCVGSTLSLTGSANGATSWSWAGPDGFTSSSQNANIPSFNAANVGVYTLIASNACGDAAAANTATINIQSLPVVSAPSSICLGSTANLTPASGGTWVSNNASISTVTNAGLVTAVGLGSTDFSFTQTSTGCTNTTTSVTVNPRPSATITSGPVSVCSDNPSTDITGTVIATGNWNLTLSDGSTASGNGNGTFSISVSPNSTITYTILSLSDELCSSVATDLNGSCVVTVNEAVQIDGQPQPVQSICSTFPVSFTVDAIGTGLTYQWYLGSTPLTDDGHYSGTQTSTLNISQAALTDAGAYHVVISGTAPCSPVVSDDAVLNVSQDITIIDQPVSEIKCAGENANFSINASGTNLNYVWRKGTTPLTDGGNISGSNTAMLTISNVTPADAASNYNVIVSGDGICPQVISVNVSLTVNPIPDVVITPSGQSICSGNNIAGLVFTGSVIGTSYDWVRDNAAITGTISGTGSGNITGTLINSGLVPETVTFTVTPVASGCFGIAANATVIVNPVANVIPSVSTQNICTGQAISDISFSSDVAGTSFGWTRDNPAVTGTIANSGSGTIAGTLVNSSANPVTVTFTITPTANGCAGTAMQVTVLVNPAPITIVTPSTQNVCNNASITTIVLTSATAGTSFSWSRNNPPGITSAIATNGTGNISGSFTNSGTDPQTVLFNISGDANGCAGIVTSASIVVNPTAVASVNTSSQTVCSQSPITSIVPSSTTPGAILQWVRDNATVTGIANSGSGTVAGTLTNPGNTSATVNFQFTPVINGCAGTPITASVLVNAKPTLSVSPASQNVCYGNPITSIVLNNPNNVSGSSITWTRDNPSGISTSLPLSGSSNISGTITNNSTSNVLVTFTITVTSPAGCSTSSIATVNLYPELIPPTISATQVVCTGSTPAPLTGTAATGGSGTYTYQWQSSTTGGAPWTNVGTNSLTYAAPSQARYYRLLVNDATCGQKISNIIEISVASSFANNFDYDPDPTTGFCSGSSFNYQIISASLSGLFGSTTNYVRYNWSANAAYVSGGPNPYGTTQILYLFGVIPIGFYFEGTANFTFQNLTAAPVTTPITITPSLYNSSGNVICNLTPKTFNVTINPVPVVNAVSNQTYCAGTSVTPTAFSGVATSYSWSNNNTSIGLAANGTGSLPTFTPVNNGTTPVNATITVTPTYTNAGRTCTGTSKTFTITINPKPTVNAISNITVCHNAPVSTINFGSNISGVTYNWTNSNTSIGLAASGSGSGIAGFNAVNNGSSPVVATVSVTATYTNNAVGCAGTVRTFTITVNPSVTAGSISGNASYCIGGSSTLTTNGTAGGTWSSDNSSVATVNPSSGVVSAVAQGSANIIYTVSTGCNSPQQASYPITVNPNAVSGTITGTNSMCIGSSENFSSNGDTGGSWSSSNSSVLTVSAGGQVTAIAQGSANIIYSVTGCNATPSSYAVTVNPDANAGVISGAASLCIGANGNFSSNGDTGGTWSSSNTAIATVDGSTGLVSAVGSGTVTISYLVSSGCNAPKTATKSLVVNPNANAGVITGSATMCPGTNAFFFSNGNPGTWSSSNTAVATVNASTGLVSTVSQGTSNIIYTVSVGCNSPVSTSFPLTVNTPAPNAIPGNINGETPVCVNSSSFTYNVPNTPNATSYTWTVPSGWSIISGQGTNSISVSSGNAGGNITVSAGNSCGSGPVKTKPVGIIPAGTWAGTSDYEWHNALNWCGGVPTSSTNVVIPASTPNNPKIHVSAFANNLTVQNGAELDLDNELTVYGSITAHSNIEADHGTLEIAGTGSKNIGANIFDNDAIGHLRLSNAGTVNLNGKLNIYGSLSFSGSGSVFETNDHLTLKSTNTNTAWVGDLTGRTINGNVTVERHIPNHSKAWQFISVPVTGNQTINQAWQDSATAPNQNRYPGYGTMLTGSVANATSVGFDAYTPAGPSIKVFNSATNSYVGLPNTTSTPVANPKGYMVLVRGDRSVITANAPANATVLRTKGRLHQPNNAPATINVAGGKFESVGNPYASAIDFRSLNITGGIQTDFFYMWDPKLTTTTGSGANSAYGLGGFQTFSWNGTDFDVTPGGGSYGGNNRYIESGQAFFVSAPFTAGTLSFGENAKMDGSHSVNKTSTKPIPQLLTRLHVLSAGNSILVDGARVQFNAAYSNQVDEKDAIKINNGNENLGLMRDGKKLAVESRNPISLIDTIFLNLTQLKVQSYQFEFVPRLLGGQGRTAYLEDRFLRNRTVISLTDTTRFNFSVINNPGSYAADRFIIVFQIADVVVPDVEIVLGVHRNTNDVAETRWTVTHENDIRKYTLERSLDGENFEGVVSADANLRLNGDYQAVDLNALPGNCWYRVKSVNVQGDVVYSNRVLLEQVQNEPEISIYPNPVKGKTANLEFTGMTAGKYSVALIGAAGVKFNLADIQLQEGRSRKSISLPIGISPGIYQIQVQSINGLSIVKTLQVAE